MRKLKDKYKVEHIEAGHTPDGYSINERIQLEEKDSHNHVEIYKGGGAASFVIGFEDNQDKKSLSRYGC